MLGYNEVILLGNLTKEPELKKLNNSIVCNNTMAINGLGRDGESTTTFVDVSFWDKNAEILKQYGTKGTPIFMTGRLKVANYEKDGERKVQYSVVVSTFRFLSYPKDKEEEPEPQQRRQQKSWQPKQNNNGGEEIPF